MSTKRCAYKGCGAFSKSTHPSPETFYAFPKDPERCQIWMKLGGCRDPIPATMRYFCSKHFDESKYVAHNQRRNQLLSTAVPWPYNKSPQEEAITDDVDYQCVVSTIDDNDEPLERFQVDEVSVEVSNEISNITDTIEDALHSYEYHDDSSSNEFTISALPTEKKKRRLDTANKQEALPQDLPPGPPNNITSNRATSSTIIADNEYNEGELKLIEELEESMLIESHNLTTFIFKGQEYIQMPKEDYVSEKMALLQKIKAYEEILKNVKQLMDNVTI